MARIQINDLPLVEKLTPEQEEEILGAGRQTVRPTLESLESREMMDAALGGTMITGILAQASAKAHVRAYEVDLSARTRPVEHTKISLSPLTQQSSTLSTDVQQFTRSTLPLDHAGSSVSHNPTQGDLARVRIVDRVPVQEKEASIATPHKVVRLEETQNVAPTDLVRSARIIHEVHALPQAAAPASETVDQVIGEARARRIVDSRPLDSALTEQAQVQEANAALARLRLAEAKDSKNV